MVRFYPASVEAQGSKGSRLARAQGSRELSSHAADARKVGLGRAEVGVVWAGSVGTGHLDLVQNGSLSLWSPRTEVQHSSLELELALLHRATTTDCDLLLHVQDQDCGVAPVDFGGPLDLDTLALALVTCPPSTQLSLLPIQNGSASSALDVWQRRGC